MRFYEISSGFRVVMNEEQEAILAKAAHDRRLRPEALDEREQEVARLMVSRGLLSMDEDDKGTFYAPNDTSDLWRI